jgi:hypothetical protein
MTTLLFENTPTEVTETPFDPRTEVSADARKIVKNLWVIFVLLPFVTGLLILLVSSIK